METTEFSVIVLSNKVSQSKKTVRENVIFACADKQNAQSTWNELRNLAECPVIWTKNNEEFLGISSPSGEVARGNQWT